MTILSRDVDLTDTGLGYVSVWLETNPYRNENLVIYGYAVLLRNSMRRTMPFPL